MPFVIGLDACLGIRQVEKDSPTPPEDQRPSAALNRGIPVIAVTASLPERDRNTIIDAKMDGWLRALPSLFSSFLLPSPPSFSSPDLHLLSPAVKPIDFKRLKVLMKGALDPQMRKEEVYRFVPSLPMLPPPDLTTCFRRPGNRDGGGLLVATCSKFSRSSKSTTAVSRSIQSDQSGKSCELSDGTAHVDIAAPSIPSLPEDAVV